MKENEFNPLLYFTKNRHLFKKMPQTAGSRWNSFPNDTKSDFQEENCLSNVQINSFNIDYKDLEETFNN